MKSIVRVAVCVQVGLLLALAAGQAFAQSTSPSDELLITSGGATPADIVIPETPGLGAEPSALYAPAVGINGLEKPGALAGLIPAGGVPGLSFVVLTEPANQPPDSTELPPVSYIGPNGQSVTVSDVLVNGLVNQSPNLPPFIALVSDNNPDLQTVVNLIPPGTAPVVEETGQLQDLTGLMVPQPVVMPGVGPLKVQVMSDVSAVPEPSTLALLGVGALGLLGCAWRRRKQVA